MCAHMCPNMLCTYDRYIFLCIMWKHARTGVCYGRGFANHKHNILLSLTFDNQARWHFEAWRKSSQPPTCSARRCCQRHHIPQQRLLKKTSRWISNTNLNTYALQSRTNTNAPNISVTKHHLHKQTNARLTNSNHFTYRGCRGTSTRGKCPSQDASCSAGCAQWSTVFARS